MISVIWKSASVIAGRTSALRPESVRNPVVQPPICTTSPRPKDGSQPSTTAKIQISRMPVRKVGSETPIREPAMKRRESQLSGRRPV